MATAAVEWESARNLHRPLPLSGVCLLRSKIKRENSWVSRGLVEESVFCRPIEVDYDTDDSGLFRAKGSSKETKGAKVILDSTVTKINTPLDLMATQTIDEEQLGNRVKTFRLDWEQ